MKIKHYPGFQANLGLSLIFLSLFVVLSCDQREERIAPETTTQNDALSKHFKFLEESTGFERKDIVYEAKGDRFIIDNDIVISKKAVEDYLIKGTPTVSDPNKRTEQRRYTYIVGNSYITNVKYYIGGSVPSSWRTAISQAIAQWNAVTGTKVFMSEVSSSSNANVIVDAQYDNVNNWVARAALPYSNGAPGGGLTVNTYHNGMEAGQKLFAMAHEMGHNIGLLHTNLTDGAIIPGTPQTDANSVMNSFVLPWNGFTYYDQVAVRVLYPEGCVAITPYLSVNGGAWQQTTSATLNAGGSITLGPQPLNGTWQWTGPNGFNSTSRQITINNIQSNQAGGYTAAYTINGCTSYLTFNITVNGGGFSQTVQAESYFAMQGVQLEGTSDSGGGQNVGWIDVTDWMAYSNINIPTSGTYLVEYRVASPNGSGVLSLDLNGGAIQLGSRTVPNTGGWQNWTTVSHTVNINAGTYNFGIYAQAGGWNINWWRITRQ